MRKFFDKAQGATEYLLILAGAIFVAAILLALLANMTKLTKNEAETGLDKVFNALPGCDQAEGDYCDEDTDCDTDEYCSSSCVCVAGGGGPGSCDNGNTRSCGITDVGECKFGTQTCSSNAWGPCSGAIGPIDEICDGLDNDCDGTVDNGCGSDPCGDDFCDYTGLGETCLTCPGDCPPKCNNGVGDPQYVGCNIGEENPVGIPYDPPICENQVPNSTCWDCPVCGNGVRQAGEACDAGDVDFGDNCQHIDGTICNADCSACVIELTNKPIIRMSDSGDPIWGYFPQLISFDGDDVQINKPLLAIYPSIGKSPDPMYVEGNPEYIYGYYFTVNNPNDDESGYMACLNPKVINPLFEKWTLLMDPDNKPYVYCPLTNVTKWNNNNTPPLPNFVRLDTKVLVNNYHITVQEWSAPDPVPPNPIPPKPTSESAYVYKNIIPRMSPKEWVVCNLSDACSPSCGWYKGGIPWANPKSPNKVTLSKSAIAENQNPITWEIITRHPTNLESKDDYVLHLYGPNMSDEYKASIKSLVDNYSSDFTVGDAGNPNNGCSSAVFPNDYRLASLKIDKSALDSLTSGLYTAKICSRILDSENNWIENCHTADLQSIYESGGANQIEEDYGEWMWIEITS